MAVIHCTQKLLTEMGLKASGLAEAPLASGWHANTFRIDRHKCVLFTHDETLFSVFVPWLHKRDFLQLNEIFSQGLFKAMLWHEFQQERIETVLETTRKILYGKAINKSVLGSMNDIRKNIEFISWQVGGLVNLDLMDLSQRINRTPYKATGFNYPVELFKAERQPNGPSLH